MTRAPIRLLPILAMAVVAGACAPPAGYSHPDIQADYAIGNHLFDVRAVRAGDGYNVYVSELGGYYLNDVATLDTATHLEAAEYVLSVRCEPAVLESDWRTFGVLPAPQPTMGIIAQFTCA